jgi:hypothetical protein
LCDKQSIILKSIRSYPNGAKGALVKSVELCISFWFSNGHFILYGDPLTESFWNESLLDDEIQNVRSHSQSFVKMMGIVISYMARLYSIDSHENVDALADLIKIVVLRELDHQKEEHIKSSTITAGVVKKTKVTKYVQGLGNQAFKHDEAYSRKIQFQFLLQLRKQIIPKLKPKLAVRFQLVKEYNAVYG